MINLYTQLSYKQLYKQLLEIIKSTNSLFTQNWIVVPNHSAMTLLKQAIARDLGVCTQIKFIMPLSFNWEILKNITQSNYSFNVFNSDTLVWKIFHAINRDEKYRFLKQESDLINFNQAY